MEEKKKNDRRVVKTKKAIRNAFIKLLGEKDYNDISVKDIADEADVDRKTVYNYYSGIYEIRDELENELIALLNEAAQKLDLRKHLADPKQIFDILTETLNSDLELYGNLIKMDAKSYLLRKMVSTLTRTVKTELEKTPLSNCRAQTLEFAARYITSGILAAYQFWFNSDRSLPLDELSEEIGQLVLYGTKGLEEMMIKKEKTNERI